MAVRNPSVDDLIQAVGRSARAEAEAEVVARRLRPPPGGMILPRPSLWPRALMATVLAGLIAVAASVAWFAYDLHRHAPDTTAHLTYRAPPLPLPAAATLRDDTAFAAVRRTRPRDLPILLRARALAFMPDNPAQAMNALDALRVIGQDTAEDGLVRAEALVALGQRDAARRIVLALDSTTLNSASRAALAGVVERLMFPLNPQR